MATICIAIGIGTRPEAIKLAPVVQALQAQTGRFRPVVVLTSQHRELLQQALRDFRIRTQRDFRIMRPNQNLSYVATEVLRKSSALFTKERPDLLLVQGDTTTTMAMALAAFYAGIPIGHVEAGLRTYDLRQPFPEEMNRVVVDHIADLLFAPTAAARGNLIREGLPPGRIHVTGNTAIDALRLILARGWRPGASLRKVNFNKKVILVTVHRRENFGTPLRHICQAIQLLHRRHAEIEFLFLVHPNPNVARVVRRRLNRLSGVHLLKPLSHADCSHAMQRAFLLLTDSGGIQEEAPFLGKAVLVLRNVTERPEAVAAGNARVVGTETAKIIRAVRRLLYHPAAYQRMSQRRFPFGDGHAAPRIVRIISEFFRRRGNVKRRTDIARRSIPRRRHATH